MPPLVGWAVGGSALCAAVLAQRAAITSAPTMVYDWVTQHCPKYAAMPPAECVPDIREFCDPDVVDACPRVWANAPDSFVMLGSVDGVSRPQTGPSLETLTHTCRPYANATYDSDLAHFRDHEWIEAPVAFPHNATVYALVHVDSVNGTSETTVPNNYLYTSITLFASVDGGVSFSPARPPPAHLVATSPFDNRNGSVGSGIGFGMPSSVLWVADADHEDGRGVPAPRRTPSPPALTGGGGAFYSLLLANWGRDVLQQPGGLCLLRTRDITDPGAWRAWNGSAAGFRSTVNASPLLAPVLDPTAHVCQPLVDTSGALLNLRHMSLLWSTYYSAYLLFGENGGGGALNGTGWAFSLSPDLLTWSPPQGVDNGGYVDPSGNASIHGPLIPMPGEFVRDGSDPKAGTWWRSPDSAFKARVTDCTPCPGVAACENVTLLPSAAFNALPNATLPFSCSFVYNMSGTINYVYSVVADGSTNAGSGGGDPSLNSVGQDASLFLVAKKCAGVTYTHTEGVRCTPLDALGRDVRDVVRTTLHFE